MTGLRALFPDCLRPDGAFIPPSELQIVSVLADKWLLAFADDDCDSATHFLVKDGQYFYGLLVLPWSCRQCSDLLASLHSHADLAWLLHNVWQGSFWGMREAVLAEVRRLQRIVVRDRAYSRFLLLAQGILEGWLDPQGWVEFEHEQNPA